MSHCGSLRIFLTWSLLSFLIFLNSFLSSYLGEFSTIILLNIFSDPCSNSLLPGTPIMNMLVCLMISHKSLGSTYLFSSSPFPPPWIIYFQLSFLQFFWLFLLPGQIWCWNPPVNFSCQLLYFFSSKISVTFTWFFLNNFYLVFFSSLFMFSISSLTIFKTDDLNFCLVTWMSGLCQAWLISINFVPFNEPYSYFFVCLWLPA